MPHGSFGCGSVRMSADICGYILSRSCPIERSGGFAKHNRRGVATEGANSRRETQMNAQDRIRILSVDDNALLREGLAAIIGIQQDMVLVSQAVNGADAIRQYRTFQPDVTLMDLRLPDLSGIDAMIAIRAEFPEARVILLTTFEDDVENRRAMEAGAKGYLLKTMPPNQLVQAIRHAHSGKD